MDFFQKSVRKCRKSKDTKGTKKDTKDKEKSNSKKTAKKKKNEPKEPKEVKDLGGKSSRSMRKTKIKKKEKKSTAEVEIFDPSTFTFKVDTSLVPEAENHTISQTAAFETFATNVVTAGVDGLIKDYFEQIAAFVPVAHVERTIFDQNTPLKKNRYKDVVCNDKTRVVLHDGRPGDYIHANYVKGTKFILTQGPLKDTMPDFWRMVVQEGASAICMLCELVENGKTKCEAYFPDGTGQSLTFGDIVVTCEEATQQDTHTQLKTLMVNDKKVGKSIKVTHYKIVTWPDKTVAISNLSILRTHRLLRRLPGPSIIHCSAGVGRTGTFAAIEIGVQCLLNGRTFQVAELVKALRHCRLVSVQMDTQYLMLAEAILDCGVSFKYIEDSKLIPMIESFKEHVAEYVKAHPPPIEKPVAPTITVTAEKPTEEIPPNNPRQSGSGRSPRRSKEKVGNQPIPQSPRGSKEKVWRSDKQPTPAVPAVAAPTTPPPPPATPPAPPAPVPAAPVPAPVAPPPPPPVPMTPAQVVPPAPAAAPPKPVTPPPAAQPCLPSVPSKPHLILTAPTVIQPLPATPPKPPVAPIQTPALVATPVVPPKPLNTPMNTPVVSPVNAVKPAITPMVTPAIAKPTTPPVPTPTTPPVSTPPPIPNQLSPNKPSAVAKSQYL